MTGKCLGVKIDVLAMSRISPVHRHAQPLAKIPYVIPYARRPAIVEDNTPQTTNVVIALRPREENARYQGFVLSDRYPIKRRLKKDMPAIWRLVTIKDIIVAVHQPFNRANAKELMLLPTFMSLANAEILQK